MKQLLWKELRENIKWGLLGFLFVYFMLCFAYVGHGFFFESQDTLSFFSCMAAFLGLALGLVQIFSESAPDRWAFLMHRPASARQIVLSKAIVGISLLVVIWLLVVVLVMFQLVSLQQLIYPMYWFRPIPAFVAILVGIPAYLSGLMFIIWKPRWKFARFLFLGFIGAYACMRSLSMTSLTWNFLWVMVLGDLLVSACLLVTVLNVFQKSGEQPRATWIPRLVTLTCTSTGALILLVASYAFLSQMAPTYDTSPTQIRLQIGSNGEFYRVAEQYDRKEQKNFVVEISNIYAPEDKPFQEQIEKHQLKRNDSRLEALFAKPVKRDTIISPYSGVSPDGVFRYGRHQRFKLEKSPGFLTISDHEGLLMEYGTPEFRNRFVMTARVGKNGYSKPYDPQPESFGRILTVDQAGSFIDEYRNGEFYSQNYHVYDRCLLVCADAIYKIIPKDRSVEKVYSAPEGEPILNVGHCADDDQPIFVIEHARSLRVFNAIAEKVNGVVEGNNHPSYRQASLLMPGKEIGLIQKVGPLKDARLYVSHQLVYLPKKNSLMFTKYRQDSAVRIVEIAIDGTVASAQILGRRELRLGTFDIEKSILTKLLMFIIPAAYTIFCVVYVGVMQVWSGTLVESLQKEWLISTIYLLYFIAYNLGGQWYCRRCRFDRQQTRRCFWATLLLGPAGLIAFWVIEEPPHLEPCEECGKLMSVRFDVCPACGASRGDLPQSDRNIIAEELTLVKAEGISSQHPSQVVPS
ncbi:MAG: hypothetical protein JKY95_06270 [Planctomycetaceae bacterium]|nr:hypothetical protein [Planctomycetaceae bacterium]